MTTAQPIRCWTTCLLVVACCLAGLADDKMLGEALRKDETLGRIVASMDEVRLRQEDSSVFERENIDRTAESVEELRQARTTAMKAVIEELTRSGRQTKDGQVWRRTREHYAELARMLKGIGAKRGERLEQRRETREMLQQQKALVEATQELQKEMEDGKTGEQTLEKLAELAEQQEKLRNSAEESQAQDAMQKAEEALSEADLADALEHQQQAVAELSKELAEEDAGELADALDGQNPDVAELAQELQEQRQLDQQLDQIENTLEEMIGDPIDAEQQQQAALEMNDASQKLAEMQVQEAAEDMVEAMQELMAEELKEARESVQEARQQLTEELAANLQQLQQLAAQAQPQQQPKQQQPPQQPVPQQESQDVTEPNHGLAEKAGAGADRQSGWEAALPAKERSALLAARKARYTVSWEQEVKRYFTELAR